MKKNQSGAGSAGKAESGESAAPPWGEPVFCVLCGREGHRSSNCPMQLPPETADEKSERLIREARESMQAAYRELESTGCFDARGQADAERMRMEELIRGRSAAMVRQFEIRRGLI